MGTVPVVLEPQGTSLHGTPQHSSVGQRLRLSGSGWLAWARGQLRQSRTVSSGLWEGLGSLAVLSQPPGGWSTVRAGRQAAAKEQDPSSSPWEPHGTILSLPVLVPPEEHRRNTVEGLSKQGAHLSPPFELSSDLQTPRRL